MTENLNVLFFVTSNPVFPTVKINKDQDKIADYSYIGRSYRVLSQQFGNGDAVSYLYDQGRRMTTKEAKNKNSDLINKYNYGYNKVHMKKYEQRGHDSNKGDVFAYDEIYRLSSVKFNSPEPTNPATDLYEKKKALAFDDLSNILRIVETLNGQDKTITTEIPDDSNYSRLNQYERFDQWGLGYDKNGNLTQKGTQHFAYDYKNKIVKATDVNSTVNFKYDALGRRIKKEVTIGSQSNTTNFYYSGYQIIEERDGDDQVIRQYIYGNGIDEVLRFDKYNDTVLTPYYFHINGIGSVTAVTDANGNIIERVEYDIYGMPTFKDSIGNVISKSSISNNIMFQGREYDPELNLYYFRARYYDPIMGRFLQTDPMDYQDSMNLYLAFNMNSINFGDPLGMWKIKGQWNSGSALVQKETGDTLQGLAKLITGNENDWVALNTFENDKIINVIPLIKIFENRVRKNIVKATNKFSAKFAENRNELKIYTWMDLNESQINSLFDLSTTYKSDCYRSILFILSKGLIDTIEQGEFDNIGLTPISLPINTRYGISLDEAGIGDATLFKNRADYLIVHNGIDYGYSNENVIKVGEDSYYGFPSKEAKSYQEWKIRLAEAFNFDQSQVHITANEVPGYVIHKDPFIGSPVTSLDFIEIVRRLFLFRSTGKAFNRSR